MTILAIFCMLSTVRAAFVGARGFHTSTASRYLLRPTTTSSFLGINGDDQQDIPRGGGGSRKEDDNERKEGRTGWQHSVPSENSNFWSPGTEKTDPLPEQKQPFRTGWLHNTAASTSSSSAQKQGDSSSDTSAPSQARQRLELAMKQQERNHRMSLPTFHAAEHGETVTTEHFISLPLERPNKQPRLDVYFCIVEKVGKERAFFESLSNLSPRERAKAYVEHAAMEDADSMILYLQGGPGYGAPTPVVGLGLGGSWAGEALKTYKRVVLMDQRGTGRSTPVTKQYLERTFPDLFLMDGGKEVSTDDVGGRLSTAVQQVSDYLTNFRADNIVYDAEEIRDALLVPNLEEETGKPKAWGASLGQSFGGFCSMSYLSLVEHPPKVMLLTGGIAPMLTPVYDVYCMLWDRVRERNYRYYDMYPGDVPVVKSIVRKLLQEPATLPSGGKLTSRRFLQLGLGLGSSPSAFASMHALLSSAFLQSDDLEFSRGFLKQIDEVQSFDDAPFYFWLHESIYADGAFNSPTNWAAHRAYIDKCKACSDFDYTLTCSSSDDRPVLFFGEHVFPWMAEDFAELSGVGLTQVANSLASRTDWPKLYDAERMRAALDGKTSAAAAVYHEDMYVEFEASMKVAARGGPLEKCKVWVTNEYQHSGLRDDGAKIFSKLLGMATGSIRTPS